MVRQMRLSDPVIQSLKAPKKGAVVFPDDLVPGFGVCVSEGGTKSYVLKRTFPIGPVTKSLLGPPRPDDACYFPALGLTSHFDGFSKRKPKLERRCGVSDWTIHDLRRTFVSGLSSIGIQLAVIERLVNHVSGSFGGIVSVYQHYDFLPEMREAMLRWEEHIVSNMS